MFTIISLRSYSNSCKELGQGTDLVKVSDAYYSYVNHCEYMFSSLFHKLLFDEHRHKIIDTLARWFYDPPPLDYARIPKNSLGLILSECAYYKPTFDDISNKTKKRRDRNCLNSKPQAASPQHA